MLDDFILKERNELVHKGIEECRNLLGKQKSRKDYFFYEGSIEGFMGCLHMNNFSDYENRINELKKLEITEISKSSLKSEAGDIDFLREQVGIYNPDEGTDYDELFKIKGRRTQIEFVYHRLLAMNVILNH